MSKENAPEQQAQNASAHEEHEKNRFTRFLGGLTIFHDTPKHPVRTWMTWAGVIAFIGLVIAYYVINGG